MIRAVEHQPVSPDDWYAQLLLQHLLTQRPLRTLVISGRPKALASAGVVARCSVRLQRGDTHQWHTVACLSGALPFQADVFDLVVLHDCVAQSDERTVAAVRGAMPGGSQLLIMGRGWFSPMRLRARGRAERAFRVGWIKRRLEQLGFVHRGIRGRGVGGYDLVLDHGPGQWLQSGGDQLLIKARRREGRPDIRLVRFSTPRRVFGGAAAWEGANREIPE